MMPFFFSFEEEGKPISPSNAHTFEYVEYFVDFIYIMDIVVAFRTSYVDSVGDEITKPSMIAKRYIAAGFMIDFLATLSVLPAIFPIDAYSHNLA